MPYTYRRLSPEEQQALVNERLRQGHPMHAPPHPFREEKHYLLTVINYEHAPIMNTEARRFDFYQQLHAEATAHKVEIHAWVILPNHYHLLVWVEHLDQASTMFQRLHGRTSHHWNLADNARGRTVWYRFRDRAIRDERHYYTALNYVHYNPVKHGYVERLDQWPHSSFHEYLEARGRDWLVDVWRVYPCRNYGKGWDD